MLAQHPAFDHDGPQFLSVVRLDAQLDVTVIKQQRITRANGLGQIGVGGRHAAGSADEVTDGDAQRLAGHELDGRPVLQQTRADLRPAEILQDGNRATRLGGRLADACDDLAVRLLRPVREVQTEHVDPRPHEFPNPLLAVGGRAERGNDLRVSHGCR